ncbi:glycosyltransferase family 4 protein [Nitratireductor pacificus]|uniref:Group 1 glycosyl transferase n=1 Tax=Nitratireductor pacificus pht-3B TaxID=391937 RepID=K2N2H2_9HYPH|nr:glycosyltransferase family 4 protein [Nitratireductor pacificus]EKF18453.1 group 1 glycosyl transferase [Nitratireductor pacificus pht-3B]
MRPDRVVIINDRSADVGGASNLSRLSARMLREADIPVTFFAGDRATGEADPDSVNLGGAPLLQQGRISAATQGLYNRRACAGLEALIDRLDTPGTVYHVHGWSKILSPSIFRPLARLRERVILHAHDYFLACPNGGFVNYPRSSVCDRVPMSAPCLTSQCDKRGFHQKAWRTARHALLHRLFDMRAMPANIVLVHDRMRDYFRRAGIDTRRMVTIRNPVMPFLRAGTEPWRMGDFFFIGRLEPEKGFEDAAAAARLAGARLHVIGEGAGRSRLESAYPEVVLHGWRTRDEIAALLRCARCVVVSSRVPEPFGLAVLEAAGSGIPVILPAEALLSAEIVASGAGLRFPAGDIGALAAAMRTLSADDAAVERMSGSARRAAGELAHTPQSWAAALIALYAGIVENAAASAARSDLDRSNPFAGSVPANPFGQRTGGSS